jgi:uncharacterized protein (DUF488 family)
MTVYTIGHSTRPVEATIAMLRAHGVARLVDIRTIPGSRRNPQYGRAALARALEAAGIAYEHRPGLGGLRRPRPDSPNAAWRNASFRGYADYMQTDAFRAALAALLESAARETIAVMCAEALPWRCHRSLLADALLARGVDVRHIMGETEAKPHALTPFGRVLPGGAIIYDGAPAARRARKPLAGRTGELFE